KALVLVQSPIALSEHSAPQPDLALLRLRADYYRSSLAGPHDVLLIVEVVQSSVTFDRDEKIPLYARHDIAEAWLVDLDAACLGRYRDPRQEEYASVDTPGLGAALEIAALPGTRVHLSALLT